MTMSKRAAKRLLEEWRKRPVGTDVIVDRGHDAPKLRTRTRCQPYLLSDGTPALLVRGIATHVPLTRLELDEP